MSHDFGMDVTCVCGNNVSAFLRVCVCVCEV